MALERYFTDLADETKPLKEGALTRLSGLISEEIEEVRASWPKISSTRRFQIIGDIVEMAEESVELDFTPIFKIALTDDNEEVRERAVAGLWECEERSLISAFINLLRCDPSEKVRTAAAQALGKFAALAEDKKLLPQDGDRVRQALLEVVNDETQSLEVRRRSMEALSPFNDQEIKTLIRWAYEHPSPKLRESALYAMGHNADPEWLPTIVKEMSSNSPSIRYEAASACGGLGEEAAIPYLIPLVRDEDLQVRLSAISSLGAIGGSVAKKVLIQCLRSPDEAVQDTARQALEAAEYNEEPLSFKFSR